MEDNLNIIVQFANIISGVIKQFAELCREHSRKMQQAKPEFEDVRNQLIRQRKKRMELEEIIRQRVSGAQPDQLPTDLAGHQEERKRPKTAFTLFVTDQRDKILREHPTLDLYKITTMAAIKWKKLSRDQQLVYQKKLEEMNRITEKQNVEARNKMHANSDKYYVKKEFGCQNEENYNEGEQNEQRQQQKYNISQQNTINNINATIMENYQQNPITGTLALEEKILPAQETKPRQKGIIQNMLDLFHTQLEQTYKSEIVQPIIQNEENQLHPLDIQPVIPQNGNMVDPNPSLVIVQAANENNPIVIPPTIQQ